MTISMYQASVPAFVRALNNLAAILEKVRRTCEHTRLTKQCCWAAVSTRTCSRW
jgi:hypothetical protein